MAVWGPNGILRLNYGAGITLGNDVGMVLAHQTAWGRLLIHD